MDVETKVVTLDADSTFVEAAILTPSLADAIALVRWFYYSNLDTPGLDIHNKPSLENEAVPFNVKEFFEAWPNCFEDFPDTPNTRNIEELLTMGIPQQILGLFNEVSKSHGSEGVGKITRQAAFMMQGVQLPRTFRIALELTSPLDIERGVVVQTTETLVLHQNTRVPYGLALFLSLLLETQRLIDKADPPGMARGLMERVLNPFPQFQFLVSLFATTVKTDAQKMLDIELENLGSAADRGLSVMRPTGIPSISSDRCEFLFMFGALPEWIRALPKIPAEDSTPPRDINLPAIITIIS